MSFVLFVTAIKDALEDWSRHKADNIENNRKTSIFLNGQFVEALWRDVKVGHVVRVSNREMIPADIVMIASSDSNGLAYVLTANLDGETNLKLRQVCVVLSLFSSLYLYNGKNFISPNCNK